MASRHETADARVERRGDGQRTGGARVGGGGPRLLRTGSGPDATVGGIRRAAVSKTRRPVVSTRTAYASGGLPRTVATRATWGWPPA